MCGGGAAEGRTTACSRPLPAAAEAQRSASLDQNSNRPYNTSLFAYPSQWVMTFMTKLLEEAFAEAAKLSAQEQDALAAVILEELASERR